MSSPRLLLVLPSLVILAILMRHSVKTLPHPRAVLFWLGVLFYGLLRGAAVGWVSVSYLGGGFPYIIREPVMTLAGVSLQEVAGWAIVLYLGWWLGTLFTARLMGQIVCACLFLASASWAVESTAVAVGWWRWTVPVPASSLTGVPFIGIVDWFFSGTDFLLPFVVLTAPVLRRRPVRYLSLLAFPAHFGAHLFVERPAAWFPIPVHHLAHWMLLAGILWLAIRSDLEDRPFTSPPRVRWLPLTALAIMLAVLAGSDLLTAGRGGLLVALLPMTLMGTAGAFALVATQARPSGRVRAARGRAASWLILCVVGLTAWRVHATAADRQRLLTDRLDRALSLRDSGDLATAAGELEQTCRLFPDAHVPHAVLGELRYRAGRLDEAHRLFTRATRIQQNYADGFRYLAVIDLRSGRPRDAARRAAAGLEIEPDDPQLLYLSLRAQGASISPLIDRMSSLDARRSHALASLAFEVDDLEGALLVMDAGLARWPNDREFHKGRVRLSLARGDTAAARDAAGLWLRSLPDDPEALDTVKRLTSR